MPPATRREALGAGLFTALAGVAGVTVTAPDNTAAAASHPDAGLFALCDEIADLERQWAASIDVSSDLDQDDPQLAKMEAHEDALRELQRPMIDKLNAMPTHTLDGFRRRARLILQDDYGELEGGDDHRGMMWAMVSALAGEAS